MNLLGVTVITSLLWMVGPACSTIHQAPIEAHETGFAMAPRPVEGGYLVDAAFRNRYNSLVATYGHKRLDNGAPIFAPPLEKDDGITDLEKGVWYMTKSAMENMIVLVAMQRRGTPP